MDSKEFPDQIHLEQIKKHLWCGREFGQAAVMVGAGFSKNAIKASPKVPDFPLWQQLADDMFKALYPSKSSSSYDILRETSGGGVLKLASEYEIVFGRSALDSFLLDSIRDTSYIPGKLHESLLSLPWSDIFTTNYDTLIERTRPSIYYRKYDLVETYPDIPGKMKPRIVKLNGSFPSHRPFIITEEDFRTYPKKFAPFVNLVQQSMMENAFCLIGFSGDDPNFLSWTGWIRDNLGPSRPPIYLCGVLNISSSKRKLLESKGIIPIDLSPAVPQSEYPDRNIHHEKALEFFLSELMKGKPSNVMDWPQEESSTSSNSVQTPLNREKLISLYNSWRDERNKYPGWIVAPRKIRNKIWDSIERLGYSLASLTECLSVPENIFFFYELNWRFEISLAPLFNDLAEKIHQMLEMFNPFPDKLDIPNARIMPNNNDYVDLDWSTVRIHWTELAFAVTKWAREENNKEIFILWMNRLEKILDTQAEWKARWYYENCLFYLLKLDTRNLRENLDSWPKNENLPFWEARRASIIAELGDFGEAKEIVEEALNKIRLQTQPYEIDCLTLSQEGLMMLLLKLIDNNNFEKGVSEKDYRDRWDWLERYHCNPWSDLELSSSLIEKEVPTFYPRKEIIRGFDIGSIKITHHFITTSNVQTTYKAHSFLLIFEVGGLPIECGFSRLYPSSIINSAKLISSCNLYWALSSLIRTGDKAVLEWFDRILVANLSQEEVNNLNNLLIESLKNAINDLERNFSDDNPLRNSLSTNILQLVPELLSRLCIRLSTAQINVLYNLAIKMYYHPIFHKDISLYKELENLFKRLFVCMSETEFSIKIPELLSLPIPTANRFEVKYPDQWVEPFDFQLPLKQYDRFDTSVLADSIANLIMIVGTGSPIARSRAVQRLFRVFMAKGLSKQEIDSFVNAIWKQTNESNGLPDNVGDYYFKLLFLPKNEKFKTVFRDFLSKCNFARIIQDSKTSGGRINRIYSSIYENQKLITEWIESTEPEIEFDQEKVPYINWTSNEIEQLLNKVACLWDEEKKYLKEDSNSSSFFTPNDLKDSFGLLIPLISRVILPRLDKDNIETSSLMTRLLSEMEQSGICILQALPMTLYSNLYNYKEISEKIRSGLNSREENVVEQAILGIFYWIVLGNKDKIQNPPSDLLDELMNRVNTRRQPGLRLLIDCVSSIVKRSPNLFDQRQVESLIISLEYLLEETKLPNKKEGETKNITIQNDELFEHRKASSELAYSIFTKLGNEKKEMPKIILQWKETSLADPFPQIRKIWSNE